MISQILSFRLKKQTYKNVADTIFKKRAHLIRK